MEPADISQRSSQGVKNPEKQPYPAYELSIPFFLDHIPTGREHYSRHPETLSPTPGNNVPSPWDCSLLCRLFYRSTFVRRPDVLNLQLDSSPFENIILDGVGYIERTFGLDVSC